MKKLVFILSIMLFYGCAIAQDAEHRKGILVKEVFRLDTGALFIQGEDTIANLMDSTDIYAMIVLYSVTDSFFVSAGADTFFITTDGTTTTYIVGEGGYPSDMNFYSRGSKFLQANGALGFFPTGLYTYGYMFAADSIGIGSPVVYISSWDEIAGSEGATYDSSGVWEDPWQYIKVYNIALDKMDTVKIRPDTISADYDTLIVDDYAYFGGEVEFGDNVTFNNHQAGVLYDTLISISSANILAGDSIMLIPAPGSGKVIFPVRIGIYFNYVTTAYTNVVDSYIKTYKNAGSAFNRYKVGAQIFTSTVDQFYPSQVGSDYLEELSGSSTLAMDLNAPYWLDLDDMDTGEGDAKIYFVYKILDFN